MLCLNIYGETKYKVSGKVLREGKGVKGVAVIFDTTESYKGKEIKFDDCISKTDGEGNYYFYLASGEYSIRCDLGHYGGWDEFIAIGPESFVVRNKNIKNLNFVLVSEIEIVEANVDILKEIPSSTPTVSYKWGRIPIFSEAECRKVAEEEMADSLSDELLKGAKMGTPVIFYDFQDNPVFYQYTVKNMGVIIAYFGVHAAGDLKPCLHYVFNSLETGTLEELKTFKESPESEKLKPWDARVPDAIEKLAEEKNCSTTDIEFLKLICFTPREFAPLDAMLKITSKNEIVFVSLQNYAIDDGVFTEEDMEIAKARSELEYTLSYIMEVKGKKNLPLMR
jgi:hypothetical protein